MTRVTFSPLAAADVEAIWDYTSENWDEAQAERYVTRLRSAIESLAKHSRPGRACNEIRPGYRKLLVGSHLLFYRMNDSGIEVVRILHQRMDVDEYLE